MNEHETFDDWPELRELRELHQDDRMPTDMRERVLRRAQLPPAPARAPLGLGPVLGPAEVALAADDESVGRRPWPGASGATARRPRLGRWLAGVALAAAAAFALWLGLPATPIAFESEHPAPFELVARPYSNDELRALGVEPGASEVRVTGMLVPGSLTRLPPLPPNQRIRCGYHFHLRQPGALEGDGLHVEYARCRAPEQLIDDGATCVEVSAIGLLRVDGHLDAARITPRVVAGCSQPH
jgi:hypothetical protein